MYKDKLFNNAMRILKQLYDEDLVEEEAIIEWSLKESKKYVSKEMSRKLHEKAAPFIKWLKEAEVEDEDESEEEKKPVAVQAKPETNGNGLKGANGQRKKSEEEEDDDDLFEFSHRVSGIQLEAVKPIVATKPVNGDAVLSSEASKQNGEADDDIDIDNI